MGAAGAVKQRALLSPPANTGPVPGAAGEFGAAGRQPRTQIAGQPSTQSGTFLKQVSGTLDSYLPLLICTSEPHGTEVLMICRERHLPIPPVTLYDEPSFAVSRNIPAQRLTRLLQVVQEDVGREVPDGDVLRELLLARVTA